MYEFPDYLDKFVYVPHFDKASLFKLKMAYFCAHYCLKIMHFIHTSITLNVEHLFIFNKLLINISNVWKIEKKLYKTMP